jgi:hypothetical protein
VQREGLALEVQEEWTCLGWARTYGAPPLFGLARSVRSPKIVPIDLFSYRILDARLPCPCPPGSRILPLVEIAAPRAHARLVLFALPLRFLSTHPGLPTRVDRSSIAWRGQSVVS